MIIQLFNCAKFISKAKLFLKISIFSRNFQSAKFFFFSMEARIKSDLLLGEEKKNLKSTKNAKKSIFSGKTTIGNVFASREKNINK